MHGEVYDGLWDKDTRNKRVQLHSVQMIGFLIQLAIYVTSYIYTINIIISTWGLLLLIVGIASYMLTKQVMCCYGYCV